MRINATHIFQTVDQNRYKIKTFALQHEKIFNMIQKASFIQNIYVDFEIGIELCHTFRFKKFKTRLHYLKTMLKKLVCEVIKSLTTFSNEIVSQFLGITPSQLDAKPGKKSQTTNLFDISKKFLLDCPTESKHTWDGVVNNQHFNFNIKKSFNEYSINVENKTLLNSFKKADFLCFEQGSPLVRISQYS